MFRSKPRPQAVIGRIMRGFTDQIDALNEACVDLTDENNVLKDQIFDLQTKASDNNANIALASGLAGRLSALVTK